MPHNVKLTNDSAQTTVFFDGDEINGVADITYKVPAIDEETSTSCAASTRT